MAYRACYHCELLFEVDDATSSDSMPCPQCGQPLEPYTAEADSGTLEADTAQPSLIGDALPAPANPAIVATHAFDGLSSSVREQLAARQASLSNEMAQARPSAAVASAPTPMPVESSDDFGASGKKGRGTKILDLNASRSVLDALAADAQHAVTLDPEPAPQPTMALEVEAPRPPSGRYGRPTFGEPADPTPAEVPAGFQSPTASPAMTPPPVRRGPDFPAPAPAGPRHTQAMPAVRPTGPKVAVRAGASRAPIYAVVAVLVLLVGGGLAWWLTKSDSGAAKPPAEGSAPPSASASDTPGAAKDDVARMTRVLADGQAELPPARGGEPLPRGTFSWVAGGPEGLSTSFGGVPGLPSVSVPAAQIERDALGESIKALYAQLATATATDGRLALALHRKVTTRTMLQFALSAHRAGFRELGLVVERPTGPGWIPLGVHPSATPLPAGGAIVLSLGSTLIKVDAHDAQGVVLSDGVGVPHKDPGARPDVVALDARLDVLQRAHPGAKQAILYGNPEMTLDELCTVLERVWGLDDKIRFARVSLGVRAP